jgi:urease accessory protein
MHFVRARIENANLQLPKIFLTVPRHTLAKRRWRAKAEDGADFGFDLETPLEHGDVIFQTPKAVYVIYQEPEKVLSLAFHSPAEAARLAWQIGNLHFPIAIREHGLLVEDDLAVRQMLDREHIPYLEAEELFQPVSATAAHHHHGHSEAGHEHHPHSH